MSRSISAGNVGRSGRDGGSRFLGPAATAVVTVVQRGRLHLRAANDNGMPWPRRLRVVLRVFVVVLALSAGAILVDAGTR